MKNRRPHARPFAADEPSGDPPLVTGPRSAPFSIDARTRLKAMFERYRAVVWQMLRRRGVNPDAAAELTQQAFLIAAERLEQIRPGSERAFLWGTGLRLAASLFRRTRRMQLEELMDLRGTAAVHPDDAVELRRRFNLVASVLGKLAPELRDVFVMSEFDELSTYEIARRLGIPRGTVASRLRRARHQFESGARIEREFVKASRLKVGSTKYVVS